MTKVAAVPSDSKEEGGNIVLDEANVDKQKHPSELLVEDVARSDNESHNNKSNKYEQKKTTGFRNVKRKSSTKKDVDSALLKTPSTLADKVMNAKSTTKRREADKEDDEDLLCCKSRAQCLKTIPAPMKAFVRLQICCYLLHNLYIM